MIKSCGIWRVARLLVAFCCVVCVAQVMWPSYARAVGMYRDAFWPVPRRSEEGSFFAVPEIMVGLRDFLAGHYSGLEVYKIERWERVTADRGYIVGFLKRSRSGKLKMCACTKYSIILSHAVQDEIDLRRQMQPEKLTDFDDLELDEKIEKDCRSASTYWECVNFQSIVPNTPGYCNAFHRELNRKVVPLAFDKQSYFDPGLRMMQKMASDTGSGKYFGAGDVYIGEYEGYVTGKRDRGKTRFICPGVGFWPTLTDPTSSVESVYSSCGIGDASSAPTGYAVVKRGEEVCLVYSQGGTLVSDCVPSPSLSSPVVQAASNGLRIKFPHCQSRGGKDSKYCDFTMVSGERDEPFGFFVIKPRLNINEYSLKLVGRCLDESREQGWCRNPVTTIDEDPEGNVTCFLSPEGGYSLSYLRRGDRYYWLRELPKVLVAFGYDPVSHRRLQCGDEKSIDLARLTQEELDKVRIRGRDFHFPEARAGDVIHNSVLCHSGLTYSYTNRRAFLHEGDCASAEKDGVVPGYCSTKFESLDNFEKIFLSKRELPSARHVLPLNPILQGHCISNFPSHEYRVTGHGDRSTAGKAQRSYALEVSQQNTTCDLLKIELWGAGESGSLHTGLAGRSGEYVLGILKLNLKPQEQKFLKIHVGVGGSADVKKKGGGNDAGANTEVFLCDSTSDSSNCPIKLFARGGGQKAVPVSKGLNRLVHYRVFEGLKTLRSKDEVFIPYQNPGRYEGYASASEVGCVRGGTAASTGIKVVPASDVFPGAGGCARPDINVLQGGANGMVKISCEKWSGPAGKVRLWEQRAWCDEKSQGALEEIADHHRMFNFSQETAKVLRLLASRQACSAVSQAPSFVLEVEKILDFVKTTVYEEVTTKQLIDKKVNTLLKDFDDKLGKEPGLLSALVPVFGGGKKPGEREVRAKINAAISEVLEKKADIFAAIARFRRMAATIGKSSADQHLTTALNMMSERDNVESFARDEKAMSTFQTIENFANNSDPMAYYTEELRQRSLNRIMSNFRDIIRKREKFAQKLETQLGLARDDRQPFNGARLEAVVKQSTEGLERFVTRRSEVLSPREGAFLRKLVALRHASQGLDSKTRRIFEMIATVSFVRNTLHCKRFAAEVERAASALGTSQSSPKSSNEIAAEIENAMKFLRLALDMEPEAAHAYITAVEFRNKTGHSYTRTDLIDAFGKIYKKHYGIIK